MTLPEGIHFTWSKCDASVLNAHLELHAVTSWSEGLTALPTDKNGVLGRVDSWEVRGGKAFTLFFCQKLSYCLLWLEISLVSGIDLQCKLKWTILFVTSNYYKLPMHSRNTYEINQDSTQRETQEHMAAMFIWLVIWDKNHLQLYKQETSIHLYQRSNQLYRDFCFQMDHCYNDSTQM